MLRWFRHRGAPTAAVTLASYLSSLLSTATAWAETDSVHAASTSPWAEGEYSEESKSELEEHLRSEAATTESTTGGATSKAEATRDQVGETTGSTEALVQSAPLAEERVAAQAISLPSGAATVAGMGESFTAQLTTGVAAFNVPLTIPAGRAGVAPTVGLVYASSTGYGEAGVGWSLAAGLFIARQTDRGIPQYDDRDDWHPEQDRFVLGGQELVPICRVEGGACDGALEGEVMPPWSDGWQYFRARVEGAFMRLFWSPDHRTWRTQSKAGMSFELGVPLDGSEYTAGLEQNPDDPSEIFRWHIVRQYDAHGEPDAVPPAPNNLLIYRYFQDGNVNYLSDIYYTPPAGDPGTPDLGEYAHHVAFGYDLRPDRNVTYRGGWLLEQRLRLVNVDVTSKPFDAVLGSPRELVRRFHLEYEASTHSSLLASVQMEGRCSEVVSEGADGLLAPTACPRLPAVTFNYQRVAGSGAAPVDTQGLTFERFNTAIREVDGSPPHSLGSGTSLSALIDVNSDGLPDVVATNPALFDGTHGVFFNRGEINGRLRFGPAVNMGVVGVSGVDANVLSLNNSNVSVLDLDGNATTDLVHMPLAKRYSVFAPELQDGAWRWQGRTIETTSGQDVKINFAQDARRTSVMDVNGDGLVDVVFASATEYQTFFSLGRYPGGDGQFGHARFTGPESAELSNDPVTACTPWSAAAVRLGDPDVRVADLNGDNLPDIVRLRAGQVLYWPGRGNGYWGTGERDACPGGTFAQDQHIEMQNAPQFGTVQPGALQLGDVNGDGLADVVEIRADAVDVYLNDNGTAFSDRAVLSDVPFKPNTENPVRLTDINGSGSTDVLWGQGHDYGYIDLTGGVRPYLLTRVDNGLGRTTELGYRSSTELMVEAAEAGEPWQSVMPLSTPVVTRVTVRDNLEKVGRAAGRYVTEYSYRDPVFEGRQREFRGFRSAETKQIGDANSPTSITRSTHLLGQCEVAQNGFDACKPEDRWRDNWREPLKGLPAVTETFDENGTYLSTSHARYELRQLYTGRDGRRVSVAYGIGQETFKYDTADFVPNETTASVPSIDVDLDGITQSETKSIPKRASIGTVRLRTASTFDDFGNQSTASAEGCVEGCAATDEIITTHTEIDRPPGDTSGWLFRSTGSFVTGSVHTAPRYRGGTEYNAVGDPIRTTATLSGTLPLDRFHENPSAVIAPAPPEASAGVTQPVDIVTMESTPNPFGTAVATRAALDRCRTVELDPQYAELPIRETIFAGPPGTDGCGERELTVTATYDRGFGLLTTHTSITNQPSRFDFDTFGRLVAETYADPENPGSLAQVPAATYEYLLPTDASVTPYFIVVSHGQDGANHNTAEYLDAYEYRDGLGRTLISLSEADPTNGDGGDFIAGGQVDYDAAGTVFRSYLNRFWSGDPLAYPLGQAPGTRYSSQQFDPFGRQLIAYGLDGEPKLFTDYHALSLDRWDAEDVLAGPHRGSFGTVRTDGHARPIESIERVRFHGALEERKTLTEYLPTGEPIRITTRRAGSPDVVRWMRYDSLGRLILNAEPNTSTGFTPDPNQDPATIKAWRYAYNDLGDLVGSSDARGCGINYHYDRAGRLKAEDYSPCLDEQAAYTAPDFVNETGIEVLHRYDIADPDTGSIVDAGGNTLEIDTSLLLGRPVSVSDRGSKAVLAYDALGRATGSAVKIVKPGPLSPSLSDRYAPRWYIKKTDFDGADRPVQMTTGATTPELSASDGTSRITQTYTRRGIVQTTGSSYGTLLTSQKIDPNGLKLECIHGDAAASTRSYSYDEQQRMKSVQTYRSTPGIWSSPPAGYSAPVNNTTGQLLLEDTDIEYDEAGNITEITDYRIAEEWPDAAKPVTRKLEYDDLYRLTRATYQYSGGTDAWTSPYEAENNNDPSVEGQPRPSPHVDFDQRLLEQRYEYDYLGNTTKTTDDANGFFDRSLGTVVNGATTAGPHQLTTASNRVSAPASTRQGDLEVAYDAAGNLTDMTVRRDGACLPAGASCWQRFRYEWDEIGELSRAVRYDLNGAERTDNDAPTDPLPSRAADVELRYAYDTAGQRVLKTAVDPAGLQRHAVYVFSSLELRKASFDTDYTLDSSTETVYLSGGGVRARVVYAEEDLPALQSGGQHVFLQLSDYLGSNTFVIDHATGELVEYSTYQAYGQTETDYRPARWGEFREAYKFSGKEEDVEVGLAYFGARYLSLGLGRWMSPDPVTIHEVGSDPNPYAYVNGRPLVSVDPNGEFAFLAVLAVALVVSVAVNVATQASEKGWDGIEWGFEPGGVATAAVSGVVGAAVGGPLGTFVGGAVASTLGGTIGTTAATAIGGLVGASVGSGVGSAAAYTSGALVSRQRPTWEGVRVAAGMGAISGPAAYATGGAIANSPLGQKLAQGLTRALGPGAGNAVAAGTFGVAGGVAGTAAAVASTGGELNARTLGAGAAAGGVSAGVTAGLLSSSRTSYSTEQGAGSQAHPGSKLTRAPLGAGLEERAKAIHSVLDARAQRARTTAVTEAVDSNGRVTRIVTSSERRLSPAQRSALNSGEVEGAGPGHAEITGVNAARGMGLTPTATGASRPICAVCADKLSTEGVVPVSPLKR